jgi:hypothetical protein
MARRSLSAPVADATTRIQPQEGPQYRFIQSSADIVVYGGAAGGGKSYGLLLDPLRYVDLVQFRAVLFRRTTPEITNPGGLWDDSANIYAALGASYTKQPLNWFFNPDAQIRLAHLQLEEDKYSWKGSQLAYIGFDELTSFTETQFFYLLSRLRTTSGMRPKVRATCNPAPGWVREFLQPWLNPEWDGPGGPAFDGEIRYFTRIDNKIVWVDRDWRDEDGLRPKSMTFIRARVDDNRALMENNPDYKATLRSLPEIERRRLLEGDWDVFEGSFFPEFEEAKHACMPLFLPEEGKQPPKNWRYWGGLDWGFGAPFAFVLCASDDWGRVHVLQSVHQAGLTNDAQADRIRGILAAWGLPMNTPIAFDPAMQNRPRQVNTIGGVVQGEADIEAFYRAGLVGCVPVDNNRTQGWSRIRKWLSNSVETLSRGSVVRVDSLGEETGVQSAPAFVLWRGFNADLIRDFPLFQFDEKKIEDMDKKTGNPHLADALRYALTLHVLPAKRIDVAPTGFDMGRRDLRTGTVKEYRIERNENLIIGRKEQDSRRGISAVIGLPRTSHKVPYA